MKKIPLTQGMCALVDDEDFAKLNMFKWYAKKSHSQWYAVRQQRLVEYKMSRSKKRRVRGETRKIVRMHNQIMQPWDEMLVHHKDSNGLNNQKHNLEVTTQTQNNIYAKQ